MKEKVEKLEKEKLTPEDIINFFASKPVFDRHETDASVKYGWSSTRGGLYNMTDIYKYFEAKNFERKEIDDIIYRNFQKQDSQQNFLNEIEKERKYNLFLIDIFNFNPEYKSNYAYYFFDISKDEALKLKIEYEKESFFHMKNLIDKKEDTKNCSAAKKIKKEKTEKKLIAEKKKLEKLNNKKLKS